MSDESRNTSAEANDKRGPAFRTRLRKQTGCCDEAQADGIPCPHPSCDCETCAQSNLRSEAPPG